MENQSIEIYRGKLQRAPTLRDAAWVCFEHRQLILVVFCAVFLGALLSALLTPRKYEAETEILVKRERADPVVTPGSNSSPTLTMGVTEEDLNSEVELLRSGDLLEKVVITCGLDRRPPDSVLEILLRAVKKPFLGQGNTELAIPLAVRALRRKLNVETIRKTNLIRVTYASPDPKLAASVLKTLTNLYLEKHLEVHRPPGAYAFFQQETARYWNALQAAEKELGDFNRAQNTVSAQAEKDGAEQKLAEFEGTLRQTRADIAATKERINTLTTQMASTPNRLTTEVRTNSLLLEQLKSSLMTLELKRTELAGKYAASNRPLREVESQIADTKAAIAQEENSPLHEDTTNRNPTYQWLADELAKARADLASSQAQAAALENQVRAYRSDLLELDKKDLEQQDLIRNAKAQEANYLLYQNKREEARISDALDQKRIVNASIAEAATVPALPSGLGPALMVLIGLIVASFTSVGAAFAKQRIKSSFRDPEEVQLLLDVPVLASFPKDGLGESHVSAKTI
jgi:uncharacterized protein involved in exopolysaccharide biosynthesis